MLVDIRNSDVSLLERRRWPRSQTTPEENSVLLEEIYTFIYIKRPVL
jgi:hypothetical protein